MTIAVIWKEGGLQYCAADTRVVVGEDDRPTTEIAAKIFTIPLSTSALDLDLIPRIPHYWTQYGFVFAGSVLSASATAVSASTLLQTLVRPGSRGNPPSFEEIAEFVHRLAERFMRERRWLGNDGTFSAGFFGWCPYTTDFKVAYIHSREDAAGFRVELSYPDAPKTDGEPWLVLGSATETFRSVHANYIREAGRATNFVPHHVVATMVAQELDRTVGGDTSLGVAHEHGFTLCSHFESGDDSVRRMFNGLDLDADVGNVGQYKVFLKSVG